MTKPYIALFLTICLLYFSCSKVSDSVNPPKKVDPAALKIELVSGGGQTDTIGNPLQHSVIVKVTKNGIAASGYTVQLQGSGCNQDEIVSTPSQPDGTVDYHWSLAGDVGQQSLKVIVLNSDNQKADSVTVSATALATTAGWHNSACSFRKGTPGFCKLSTGKLFTAYLGEKDYLRYSGDNGVTWNTVKSFGNKRTITQLISNPSDEIFAFTKDDGIFYSNDAGQTWTNSGTPPFNSEFIASAAFTPGGKLLVSFSNLLALSISSDKGKTWTSLPNSAFVPVNNNSPGFNNPAEDRDGNLYIVEQQNENLFKSVDGGKTWSLVDETGIGFPGTDFSFYIDNASNWFYKGESNFNGGVYVSKDKGATYSQLIFYSNAYITNISVQSDGRLYYEDIDHGLYTYDFTNKTATQIFKFDFTSIRPYIVAKNNNIIVANLGHGYIRYYTK